MKIDNLKKTLKFIIIFLIIPFFIILEIVLFDDKQYALVSLLIAIFACIPFFLVFEQKKTDTTRLVILSIMIALSVFSRFVFSFIPHFKPVSAIVIISGMYMGSEFGFLTGALSAVLSNFFMGQGPWTPFQMFAWGVIGFSSGVLSILLKKNWIFLIFYAIISGLFYSLTLDVWTVVWWDSGFNIKRYYAALVVAFPVIVIYIVSNIIFLLILAKPIGEKLNRIKVKYGIN